MALDGLQDDAQPQQYEEVRTPSPRYRGSSAGSHQMHWLAAADQDGLGARNIGLIIDAIDCYFLFLVIF